MENDKDKDSILESSLVALDAYINLGQAYIENMSFTKESVHFAFIIEKMKDEIDKLRPHFDIINYNDNIVE